PRRVLHRRRQCRDPARLRGRRARVRGLHRARPRPRQHPAAARAPPVRRPPPRPQARPARGLPPGDARPRRPAARRARPALPDPGGDALQHAARRPAPDTRRLTPSHTSLGGETLLNVVRMRKRTADGGPERLVALADGVFAIAITLLVLDLTMEPGLSDEQFHEALRELLPNLGAYAISLVVLAGFWRDHRM